MDSYLSCESNKHDWNLNLALQATIYFTAAAATAHGGCNFYEKASELKYKLVMIFVLEDLRLNSKLYSSVKFWYLLVPFDTLKFTLKFCSQRWISKKAKHFIHF